MQPRSLEIDRSRSNCEHANENLELSRGSNPKRRLGHPDSFPLLDIQRAYALGRDDAFELGGVGMHFYQEIDIPDLDAWRLRQAWQRVIDHHEALRAVVAPGAQSQLILTEARYEIELVDARPLPTLERDTLLGRLREEMSHHVYSAFAWPMFRLVACLIDGATARLCISVDAQNIDMISLARVFADFVHCYERPDLRLEQLPLSLPDYVRLVERALGSARDRAAQDYWDDLAPRLPAAPKLPYQEKFALLKTRGFSRVSRRIAGETWSAVKALGLERGLTASQVTLAAYAEVLATWAEEPRFTINVTCSNRLPLDRYVSSLSGNFTTLIPLGFDADAAGSFADRASRLRKEFLASLHHRRIAGVQAVRDFGRAHGCSMGEAVLPCVFTSMLGGTATGFSPFDAVGRRVWGISQTPQVALDLQLHEQEGVLCADFDTVANLLPRDVAEGMADAFVQLLEMLAAGDGAWSAPPPCLTPADHLRRRNEINGTGGRQSSASVDTLIEMQVAARGSETAIWDGDLQLTYAEVWRRSGAVAAYLQSLYQGGDGPVGIALDKGWRQAVAVLGVIRSGSSYLPLDTALPLPRLLTILDASGSKLILTADSARMDLPSGICKVSVDRAAAAGSGDPIKHIDSDGPAYVIYTSGSTGEPKGVVVGHRSVVNRLLDVQQRFALSPSDRMIAVPELWHDLSVFDLLGSLVSGAALVVPDRDAARDPLALAELIGMREVTVWNSVPAMMEALVAANPRLPSLRLVLLSGDRIPVDLPDRVREAAPYAEVVSLGGPTETTIWDVCFPIGRVDPTWKRIPYGKPMRNASYHILDGRFRPRPDRVSGELLIGGAGLAKGYLNDPTRTAEKFVRHPETGERLYRSGDVGFFLPDGNIELIGRLDSQIKLRGYRIETGEVEAAVRRIPGIARAAVVKRGERARDEELVAYVVLDKGTDSRAIGTAEPDHPDAVIDGAALVDYKLGLPGIRTDLKTGGIPISLCAGDMAQVAAPERRTCRTFSREPPGLSRIGRLLESLSGQAEVATPLPRYRYPSAGSLYPVEAYLQVAGGPDLAEGVYYYHSLERALKPVSRRLLPLHAHPPHNRGIVEQSSFQLFLIGNLDVVARVYSDLALRFCLVEAGAILQLLMTEAPQQELGLCPLGDVDGRELSEVLDLDERRAFLLGIAGGVLSQEPAIAPAAPGPREPTCWIDRSKERWIREAVAQILPSYMVPARIVFMRELPVTRSGKIARAQLPEPPAEAAAVGTRVPNELEDVVRRAVSRAVRPGVVVDLDRRFFDLGINSLRLIEIAQALGRDLGRQIRVSTLFAHPTIDLLARHLAAEGSEDLLAASGRSGARRRALRASRSSDCRQSRDGRD